MQKTCRCSNFMHYHQSKGQQCCTFNRFNTSASKEKLSVELICSFFVRWNLDISNTD